MAKNTNEQQLRLGQDIGFAPEVEMDEVTNEFENYPMFGVGGDNANWKANQTIGGTYLETVSFMPKIPRRGQENKPVVKHVFRDAKGQTFGLWGVGDLDAFLNRVEANTAMKITYLGKAKEARVKGQSAPHLFKFQVAKGARVLPLGLGRKPISQGASAQVN